MHKLAIAALAVAPYFFSRVSAQCSGDVQVSSQADLDSLSGCQQYQGTISISGASIPSMTMPGIQQIVGSLLMQNNGGINTISFPQLQTVTQQFVMTNHTGLNSLSFPRFVGAGTFTISTAPNMAQLDFPAGFTQVNDFTIDDTYISQVSGLNMTSANSITITSNPYLKNFELPSLQQINSLLYATANNPNMALSAPSLSMLGNGTFRNLGSLSLQNLGQVVSDLNMHQNGFQSLNFPNITKIGATLAIVSNNNLNQISFQGLSQIGGALQISNNTNLKTVNGLDSLQEVDGTVDITGTFDKVSLPALNDVRGGFNVQTTSSSFDCNSLSSVTGNGVVRGSENTCKSDQSRPLNSDGSLGADPVNGQKSSSDSISLVANSALLGFSAMVSMLLLVR